MKVKIVSLSYARNGVGGEPFYTCLFEGKEHPKKYRMLATFNTTDSDMAIDVSTCRVTDLDDPHEKWRGDTIGGEIGMQLRKKLEAVERPDGGQIGFYDLTTNYAETQKLTSKTQAA